MFFVASLHCHAYSHFARRKLFEVFQQEICGFNGRVQLVLAAIYHFICSTES